MKVGFETGFGSHCLGNCWWCSTKYVYSGGR